MTQALRKAFRVHCDFYDPEADEYLRCYYLFKNLFRLRDSEARQANFGVEKLISTEHLYLLARTGTAESLIQGDTAFLSLAGQKIVEWLSVFDEIKLDLIEENKREAAENGGRERMNKDFQAHLNKIENKRKKMEAIRSKYTCKKAVYENAKMLDPEGGLLCHTEYKKAHWYV